MDQFRSFKDYIGKIDKYGMKSGIVKVIPPKEWRDSLPQLDEAVKTIKVKNPITQEFAGAGTHGAYTQANIEKQRAYNLPQWKALTEESQHQPPARRGERRKNTDKPTRQQAARTRPAVAPGPDGTMPKRRPGRPRKNPLPGAELSEAASAIDDAIGSEDKAEEDGADEVPVTMQTPSPSPAKRGRPRKNTGSSGTAKTVGRQPKSVAERRKYNRREADNYVDEESFKDFDYRIHNQDEYTIERCAELETAYWKGLTFAPPIKYRVSTPPTSTLGMWKATFAWHLEDVDLYSINYIHFGAPKQWYSISQEDARRFESAMKHVWPTDSKNCSQFLRHKTYLISPALLQSQYNIKVNKLVHYEGEFVITYPYGYHSGYNLGYNCAESVNFATESWLEYGKIAKKCDCEADSVWIDVADIERRLRGESTPEYYDGTDDENMEESQLPSPPASDTGLTKSKKRKRESGANESQQPVKKLKIRIRAPTAEPCVLCPNDIPTEELLRTDTGRQAHRVCALYTPGDFPRRLYRSGYSAKHRQHR
ncbi:hypothetical protein MRB53_038988 [Persea americana]|nr:hypothetical protein MRB53_038988 [Persea americana]